MNILFIVALVKCCLFNNCFVANVRMLKQTAPQAAGHVTELTSEWIFRTFI